MSKMVTIQFRIGKPRDYSDNSFVRPDPMEWIFDKCDAIGIEEVSATYHRDYLDGDGVKFTVILTFDHEGDFEIFKKHHKKMVRRIKPLPLSRRIHEDNAGEMWR